MNKERVFVCGGRHQEYRVQCLDHLIENGMVTISAVGKWIPKALTIMQGIKGCLNVGYQAGISTEVSINSNNKLEQSSKIEIRLFDEAKIGEDKLSLSHLLGKGEGYGPYVGCLPLPKII